MLISAVLPIMSIYRLPLGQYGYSGHAVNLPQDMLSFAHRIIFNTTFVTTLTGGVSQPAYRDWVMAKSVTDRAMGSYHLKNWTASSALLLALMNEQADMNQCTVPLEWNTGMEYWNGLNCYKCLIQYRTGARTYLFIQLLH